MILSQHRSSYNYLIMKLSGVKIKANYGSGSNGSDIRLAVVDDKSQKNNLSISNHKTCYKMKFGEQFKGYLDPRDQVLQHKFNFVFDLKDETLFKKGQNFLKSKLYQKIKRSVKEFLVEAVSNVVSAGFHHLNQKDLEEKQSKEFAAKNILLNIHSIFRQTIRAITQHKQLKESVE